MIKAKHILQRIRNEQKKNSVHHFPVIKEITRRKTRYRYYLCLLYTSFIIDPWWNPAAESQAIARAHRICQDKQVIAYRFITPVSYTHLLTNVPD